MIIHNTTSLLKIKLWDSLHFNELNLNQHEFWNLTVFWLSYVFQTIYNLCKKAQKCQNFLFKKQCLNCQKFDHSIRAYFAQAVCQICAEIRLITRIRIFHPGLILFQIRIRMRWDFFSVRWDRIRFFFVRWDRTEFFFIRWNETENRSSLNEMRLNLHETKHFILILQSV